jgi:2-keto-3-deoxy-L-rhamnonate aldolase RhmA
LYIQSADPAVVEFAKAADFDFIRLDNGHVLYDYAQLKSLICTALLPDLPCKARMSHLADITKLLDADAAGIVVLDVNTVDLAGGCRGGKVLPARFPVAFGLAVYDYVGR